MSTGVICPANILWSDMKTESRADVRSNFWPLSSDRVGGGVGGVLGIVGVPLLPSLPWPGGAHARHPISTIAARHDFNVACNSSGAWADLATVPSTGAPSRPLCVYRVAQVPLSLVARLAPDAAGHMSPRDLH